MQKTKTPFVIAVGSVIDRRHETLASRDGGNRDGCERRGAEPVYPKVQNSACKRRGDHPQVVRRECLSQQPTRLIGGKRGKRNAAKVDE